MNVITKKCNECRSLYSFAPTYGVASRRGCMRKFCDDCKAAKAAAHHKRQVAKRKARAPLVGMEELDKYCVRTHKEVACILEVCQESTRQLERSALFKLRKAFHFDMLQRQLDNDTTPFTV